MIGDDCLIGACVVVYAGCVLGDHVLDLLGGQRGGLEGGTLGEHEASFEAPLIDGRQEVALQDERAAVSAAHVKSAERDR